MFIYGYFRRKNQFILALLWFFLFCTLNCQQVQEEAKGNGDQDGKAQLQEKFQILLDGTQQEYQVPGMACIVLTSEQVLFQGVSGVRKLGSQNPITLNDRFHIGSNTKAMTAFLAGVLVDRGQLTWETKIVDVFPAWRDEILADYLSMTLRDVLSHRAGILPFKHEAEFERLPQWEGSAVEMRRSFTHWLLKQEPVTLGPSGHTYSNAGYCVAAAMMKEVTGVAWEDMIQMELFEPLAMDGRHKWPAFKEQNQPWGHWMQNGRLHGHNPDDTYRLPAIIVPAGDINMSVIDYGKWLQMLLCGIKGQDTLIKSSTCLFLLYGNMGFSSYSMGWGNVKKNNLLYCIHNGSAGTFFCHAVIVKELDLAVALMANSATPGTSKGLNSLRQKIVSIYKNSR